MSPRSYRLGEREHAVQQTRAHMIDARAACDRDSDRYDRGGGARQRFAHNGVLPV